MTRYSYQTRSVRSGWRDTDTLMFHVLDTQRRSDEPIASCASRDDAEKIVEALNRVPIIIGFDLGEGDFTGHWPRLPPFEWPTDDTR